MGWCKWRILTIQTLKVVWKPDYSVTFQYNSAPSQIEKQANEKKKPTIKAKERKVIVCKNLNSLASHSNWTTLLSWSEHTAYKRTKMGYRVVRKMLTLIRVWKGRVGFEGVWWWPWKKILAKHRLWRCVVSEIWTTKSSGWRDGSSRSAMWW